MVKIDKCPHDLRLIGQRVIAQRLGPPLAPECRFYRLRACEKGKPKRPLFHTSDVPVAKRHMPSVDTLETRNRDAFDFHDVAVWSIRNSLAEASVVDPDRIASRGLRAPGSGDPTSPTGHDRSLREQFKQHAGRTVCMLPHARLGLTRVPSKAQRIMPAVNRDLRLASQGRRADPFDRRAAAIRLVVASGRQ